MERIYFILGTSHVDPSVEERIRQVIIRALPDVIGVELDADRLTALREQRQGSMLSVLKLGVFPFFFTLLGRLAQHAAGRMTGMKAGSDMLTAVRLAEESQARLILLDQPIGLTLARFRQIPFREKTRLMLDLLIPWRVPRDVRLLIPTLLAHPRIDVVEKIIRFMRERYPGLTRVLLDERNAWMARRLFLEEGRVFLIVVGAAHVPGLAGLLRQDDRARVVTV